jgi:hypothetical protein
LGYDSRMADAETLKVIAGLLALVDVRKGDQWWEACCRGCYDDAWHREDRYGDAHPTERNRETEAVIRCRCVCHDARRLLRAEAPDMDPHDLIDPIAAIC